MHRSFIGIVLALGVCGVARSETAKSPDWAARMTVIEACSCPMFCQCYFNTKPASHGGHEGHEGHGGDHFCKFNNAYKIDKGSFGETSLDGAKFWLSGDLGGDLSQGKMDWAVVTFDKAATKAQRDAIQSILKSLFPVEWKSFTAAEGEIAWSATKDAATATLDGGKSAEVRLKRFQGMTDDPVVIKNLKYWGAPRNEGFVLMPNEVQAYRVGAKTYEYKGTNGFMITFDLASKDFAAPAAGGTH